MSTRDDALEFVVAVYDSAAEHEVKYPAAAFAYYGFVAFLPLLVLAVALLDRDAVVRLDAALPPLLAPEARRLVYESLATASGRTGASLLALVVLVWSGLNMTAAFRTIVERVEGTGPRATDSAGAGIRAAAGIFASLCLAVTSVGFVEGFVVAWAGEPLDDFLRPAVLLALLTASFVPLYVVASRVAADPRSALPGAFAAAVGWTGLVTGVQFYVTNAAEYALYGILSGIILIFTSLYVAAGVLMLGVVVNATAVE